MSEELPKDYCEGQEDDNGRERVLGTEKSDLPGTCREDATDGTRNNSEYMWRHRHVVDNLIISLEIEHIHPLKQFSLEYRKIMLSII